MRSEIHALLRIASAIERCFLLEWLNMSGNINAEDPPFTQLENQNFAFMPLCTVTRVAVEKRASSTLPICRSVKHQCLSGDFH
jgi:hypothetical protein